MSHSQENFQIEGRKDGSTDGQADSLIKGQLFVTLLMTTRFIIVIDQPSFRAPNTCVNRNTNIVINTVINK